VFAARLSFTLFAVSGAIGMLAQEPLGTVRGTVCEATTGAPLQLVAVEVETGSPQLGSTTDSLGRFTISNVPVGHCTVKASLLGYSPRIVHEVWVRAGKETVLALALEGSSVQLNAIEVAVERFEVPHLGVRSFTVEQGLRYPAMFQDPSRLVSATPGVSAPSDQANHLMVRGNGPLANNWLLEGAEMVSPNHLGNAGTASDLPTLTGGGVSILSAQMLGPSRFRTGAMPVSHGNALGGIMDLELRRGNTEEREWTVQAGLIGIDVSTEGPITKSGKDFHLVNYRYSTLGLLSAMGVDIGDEAISFQDLSFHAGARIGERGEWRVFGLGGISSNVFKAKSDSAQWVYDKDSRDIEYSSSMGAGGAAFKLPLGRRSSISATALWSAAYQERTDLQTDTAAIAPLREFASLYERKLSMRASAEGALGNRLRYAIGASAMDRMMVNVLADTTRGWLLRPYAQLRAMLPRSTHLTLGLAYSHFTYSNSALLEPRIDLFIGLRGSSALLIGAGVRGQLPQHTVINLSELSSGSIAQGIPDNRALGFQRSEDLTIGYQLRITSAITARAEAYMQRISDVPRPWNGFTGIVGQDDALINSWDEPQLLPMEATGRAQNMGVELSIAQAMQKGFYWQLNGSAFQGTFDAAGMERETRWSTNWTANAMAGKEWRKTKEEIVRTWGVGIRALGTGGMRYTPFDNVVRRGFVVAYTGEPYSAQLRDVYRIDLRVYLKRDRNGRTGQWALDLQNAANTRNEAYRYFDYRKSETVTRYQLGLIPNLSYRVEF
jgi:hypothetical protein